MITNQKPRRIKILGFHERDACHGDKSLIGITGLFTPDPRQHGTPGYFSGKMVYNDKLCIGCNYFFAVRYKRLPEEE